MQRIQYLKPCGPLMKTVAALSGFLCLCRQFFCRYRRFIVFKSCLFAEFVCDEEKEKEQVLGGRALMEHLISCSLWEPLRHRDARGSVILRVF